LSYDHTARIRNAVEDHMGGRPKMHFGRQSKRLKGFKGMGENTQVALVACRRKLLTIGNAVIKSGSPGRQVIHMQE
jgi:hypothetical protein